MFTPFEELEYLADYLPEEGESILVARRDGELVCHPWRGDSLRDGIEDDELYGLLVQANERLNSLAALPLWGAGVGAFWGLTAIYTIGQLSWTSWCLVPGIGLVALWACFLWIRKRQRRVFLKELRPRILATIRRRGISLHALIAGIRQHSELRTLLDEFANIPEPRPSVPE